MLAVGDEVDLSMDSRMSSAARRSVGCHLDTLGLWQGFNRLGLTEMIITKSGRYCASKSVDVSITSYAVFERIFRQLSASLPSIMSLRWWR